jgi:hypothetical protein
MFGSWYFSENMKGKLLVSEGRFFLVLIPCTAELEILLCVM